MPPRRAPSQTSAPPSRPASPLGDDDDGVSIESFCLPTLLTASEQAAFFDSVDELQQHVGTLMFSSRRSLRRKVSCCPKGINVQDILKLKVRCVFL